jgi:hypothetical protein
MPSIPDRFDLLHAFGRPCNFCRTRIMWAWTNASDLTVRMPVDAIPVAEGNVIVYRHDTRPRLLVCDVVADRRGLRALRAGGWPLYVHHRMSCTQADRWARGPVSMRPAPPRGQEQPEQTGPADEGELTLL